MLNGLHATSILQWLMAGPVIFILQIGFATLCLTVQNCFKQTRQEFEISLKHSN